MPENDVTKMKVADLKRELKLRGLSVAGNKTELQDRLQTALLDGELTLDDTALPGDDLLDEDAVLTDEEDAKILVGDENDLLKSPLNITPEAVTDTEKTLTTKATSEDDILSTPPSVPKKIVLKRQTSANKSVPSTSKENTEPTPPKTLKMSERNPITVGEPKTDAAATAAKKVTQLTAQERMELRAKKFGVNTNAATSNPPTKTSNAPISMDKTSEVVDEKQIELLKKRAERFGCVVSSKIAKLDAQERLEKRKQRFGGEGAAADSAQTSAGTNDWSEKARKRLERFGKASSNTTAVTAKTANGTAGAE